MASGGTGRGWVDRDARWRMKVVPGQGVPDSLYGARDGTGPTGTMPAYDRAPRAKGTTVVDGTIDEAEWDRAPWTAPFGDVRGDARPSPRFETTARIFWDDAYLYLAARLVEPDVWETLTEHDSVIYRDYDFEVFLDPDGDGLSYAEVEVNAFGTIFDLLLDRPYVEGGRAITEWSPGGLHAAGDSWSSRCRPGRAESAQSSHAGPRQGARRVLVDPSMQEHLAGTRPR